MKVLVLSPEKKDKESRKRRRLIVRALEDLKAKLLNPIPGRPPEKKVFPPSLFPQVFYKDEAELLEKAELVIADLTDPDFKTGFLISQTLSRGKTVLALFWETITSEKVSQWEGEENLFIECFNQDNVRAVLRQFLKFFRQRKQLRGRLIVIDGTDGSGKETQSKLLVKYLKKRGERVKYIDFPRYHSSFHGRMVGRYLTREFGGLNDISPYFASLFYALDRLTAKDELEHWLRTGSIVVANRYTTSNMAFQTARVKPREREEFLNWLIEMEYKVHKLPKEDLVIFLHLPAEVGQKLAAEKRGEGYRGRKKRDLHEASIKFLKEAEKMYFYLVKRFKHWVKIDCLDKEGKILSKEKIHQKIVKLIEKKGLIS